MNLKTNTISASGFYLRGALYVLVAVLTSMQGCLAAHVHWTMTLLTCAIAGFTTLRAFIDKSPSQVRGEGDDAVSLVPASPIGGVVATVASTAADAVQAQIDVQIQAMRDKTEAEIANLLSRGRTQP